MASTCLVTGGSGFVGGRLIERLVAHGWQVRALARSEEARRIVGRLGAQAVKGSLDDIPSLTAAAAGCDAVIHVAALFKLWGDAEEFERSNVQGTANLLKAAAAASVRRFVQVGAAAVVMGDMAPMLRVDESLPLQERAWAPYSASKARSEALVIGANRPGVFETVVVRPPMIWGTGMPTLGHMIDTVRAGQFRWVGDGSQAMSTAHVDNVCHAVELALAKGRGGEAYFVSDGPDTTLKSFLSSLMQTRAVEPPRASASLRVAWVMATVMEWVWRRFSRPGEPPITRQMLRLIGQPFTVDISKARRELGYRPEVTREQGLLAMQRG
ncbi:NAD-dependent epimerase/dehydratase family protein [Ottowia sp.]|uniref:NAD-dependent epimerase/dehydratase family protein n=1 Tax=Ottowia sp. TaxID=1898956 RepID=UPI001DC87E5F|nr:NAD-dependent epimerase/dehydratase family protein [Rhodoferax sp.]MCB2025108.1 NAD-dependent epimerase/dehydratase family protein [Ottowia sp.]MCP5256499.1 NAD-dependent epimerase/dehydratase family protein [Burkholderiaceae bacterium]